MKNQNTKIFYFLLSLILFIQLNVSAQVPEDSLYKRLGGVYNIAAVVDDFVDKLLADPIIITNKNVISAMEKITKPGLKYQITEFLCQGAGGPQKYNGRQMKESHQGLNITESEWQAMMKDFLATLVKFNIKGLEQNELLVIVGSTKNDIVIPAPAQPQPIAPSIPIPPNPTTAPPIPVNAVPALPSIPIPPNPTTAPLPQAPAKAPSIDAVQPKLEQHPMPDGIPQLPQNTETLPDVAPSEDTTIQPDVAPPVQETPAPKIHDELPPEPILEPAD